MSTMKKRIPMFLLALAIMVAMALPTFAADYNNSLAGYNRLIYGSCSLNISEILVATMLCITTRM